MEKQKQRLVSLVLALVMCVGMLPVATSTVAATEASGTCGNNLTWTLTSDGMLTISGEGKCTDTKPLRLRDMTMQARLQALLLMTA